MKSDLPIVVLKFGGTSVASPARWRRIAAIAAEHTRAGQHPVIVCSALAGITDALGGLIAALDAGEAPANHLAEIRERHVALADALGVNVNAAIGDILQELSSLANDPVLDPAWRAAVFSCGERMSSRIGAAFLRGSDIDAAWLDARTVLRSSEPDSAPEARAFLSARCDYAPNATIRERVLHGGAASVTQGFIASAADGRTVLLGRGGSDTSAAYLASVLGAERLEIWTDVPGLFTADPRRARDARLLPRVTYDEAAVLGALGAKVLHPRCLAPAQDHSIPLAIRWTDRPEVAGTIIGAGASFEARGVKAIASRKGLALIRMRRDRSWQPVGFMSEVSACFHKHGLSMDLISSSPAEIRATIDLAATPGADEHLPELMEDLRSFCHPSLVNDVSCVSIVGTALTEEMPRMAAVMRLLGEPVVHMVSHAADDTSVSYILDRAVATTLVAAIHTAVFDGGDATHGHGPRWEELQRVETNATATALA